MKQRDIKEISTCLVIIVFCLSVIVVSIDGALATYSNQTCHNCWNAQNCLVHAIYTNLTWPVTRSKDCLELCDNTTDCRVATLDKDSYCHLYNCSYLSQEIGATTFRKTNNSGTTYDDELSECYFYNNTCPDMQILASSTFIERKCIDEQPVCNRNLTQKCVNCGATTELCPWRLKYTKERKPLTINTSIIGEDPDVNQIWYSPRHNTINYLECSYVEQLIGHTVYRAACTEDCPTFEILTLRNHRGTCSEIESLSGGVTFEFCIDKCLDITHCRGVTFNKTRESCTFHDCNNYTSTSASETTFMTRRCIHGPECSSNSTIIQTCLGCAPAKICPRHYDKDGRTALYTHCHDVKASDNESIIVYYNRPGSQCKRYQCAQVKQQMGHLLYRQSCNTDCPKFEIFQLYGYGGSCEVIHSEEGSFTFHYCIDKCLDIDGCRGTTFNSTTGRCQYHTCSNHTASVGLRFMWKRCIDYEPSRDFQQICVGCKVNSVCQMPTNQMYLSTWQECQTHFSNSQVSELYMYDAYTSSCQLINCTFVEQDENMYLTVFRNSPSSDCPIFRLLTLYGYHGTCPVIGFDEGGVDLAYCINKCLDMDDCRSVSHDNEQLLCFYHNCTERTEAVNQMFVKRECMTYQEFNPTKDYIQTCKNCQNMCNAKLSSEPNQQLTYNCDTACPNCTNIMYDPLSDQCFQYQCDRPNIQGPGTTMIRKTTNQACPKFELMTKLMSISKCIPFDYDEGVANVEFCIMRCLDLDGCLALSFEQDIRNCTYHACTDYEMSNSTGILFIKNCSTVNGCSVPVIQTCLNCQQGSLCQSPFYITTSSTEDSCQAVCDAESFCDGFAYESDNMTCKLNQCSLTSQLYGSSFFRKLCNAECPVYEIYILDGYTGSCDIMPSMTEYMVLYPEICYERCLDTAGCRGVTYSARTEMCFYHSCDCYKQKPGDTFMWVYCLNGETATILPHSNSTSNGSVIQMTDIYPTATTCKPEPIYVMSCLCSTGAFTNLTNEEIVQQLVQNLAIDPESTSLNFRKYNTANDNRPVAIAIGTLGLAVLVSVIATVLVVDFSNLLKTLRRLYKRISNVKRSSE